MSAALQPAAAPAIHTTAADLRAALTAHEGVPEIRNTLPILSTVLIEASDGAVVLTTNNMSRSVRSRLTVSEVSGDWRIAVPWWQLHRLVRRLPPKELVTLSDGGQGALAITAGRLNASLDGLAADDFPDFGPVEATHRFDAPASMLFGLLDRVSFAISTEETRYYLNGIYLHPFAGHPIAAGRPFAGTTAPMLRAVATDGHRLALRETELPDGAGGMPGIIVPRGTVAILRRLLARRADPVRVQVSDIRISVSVGDVEVRSKLIDGTFPEYERVIPRQNERAVHIDLAAFIGAVERGGAIAMDRSRPVKLSVRKDAMTVESVFLDFGRVTEALPVGAVSYLGSPFETGFNGRYLRDIAKRLSKDMQVLFDAQEPGQAPALFLDPADPSVLFVLMPVRV